MLSLLQEEFPKVCRIVAAVYPSAEDDVVTSPYNSVLAMRELTDHADCVLPVENQVCCSCKCLPSFLVNGVFTKNSSCSSSLMRLQSLVDIVNKIKHMSHSGKPGSAIKRDSAIVSGQGGVSGAEKPFDAMNNIVANLLLNITRYNSTVGLYTSGSLERKNHESLMITLFYILSR